MSEQQTVIITKKQQLDAAGQAWVEYHMYHLRKHMAALGMVEDPDNTIKRYLESHPDEGSQQLRDRLCASTSMPAQPCTDAEPIYSERIDDYVDDGEMVDDDPVPVKKGKRKPAAKHNTYNQPKVRRFIQRG